jgi:hypothetical protein
MEDTTTSKSPNKNKRQKKLRDLQHFLDGAYWNTISPSKSSISRNKPIKSFQESSDDVNESDGEILLNIQVP